MRVFPNSNDSAEEIRLMTEIEAAWQESVRLRKDLRLVEKKEGLLRGQLRLIQEGLVEGEMLNFLIKPGSSQTGKLELSDEYPFLWLRILDKSGLPTKRRLKLTEGSHLFHPDGAIPVKPHD